MITEPKVLEGNYSLTETQITSFRNDGHVLTQGLMSEDEAEAYHRIIKSSAEKCNTEKRKLADRDTYGKAFLQIKNLWIADEQVKRFVLAKRFGKVAADLMGVKSVRLYHDQALFKEPGGGPTPWHQDQYYWPLDTSNMVTMWMPLVDVTPDMGLMAFASGSHKKGLVFNVEISDQSDANYDDYVATNKFQVSRTGAMKAGDATWHYGLTIHSAPGNKSERMREVMTIIYMAGDAKVAASKNQWQDEDRRVWLKDFAVGTLANSELNPIVYSD